jgi:putative transposase
MPNWPHAPAHQLSEGGAYMVTCGTYHKLHYFRDSQRLQYLHDLLLDHATKFGWHLQAWAVFSNHYHFVAQSPDDPATLRMLLTRFHQDSAAWVNRLDAAAGRKVWYNFWDSHLTFQPSYLARLQYVHTNAVHHGLVRMPTDYRWCSAAWFERSASPAFRRSLVSMKIDRLNVRDDFEFLS